MSNSSRPATQAELDREIAVLHADYQQSGAHENEPLLDFPPYRSSILRHPTKAAQRTDPGGVELFSPVFGQRDVANVESDLTIQHRGEPLGEKIAVTGRLIDGSGRPIAHQLLEVWQANAGGRYVHGRDQHPAPLDPNFTGCGRVITDSDGSYRFMTIKPGPYPWKNHYNAWRPAHIHFSVFGRDFTQRLITQMYFPGDPLFALDPILQSLRDDKARQRLVARYDHDVTAQGLHTGYRWDIVLTGGAATPMEPDHD